MRPEMHIYCTFDGINLPCCPGPAMEQGQRFDYHLPIQGVGLNIYANAHSTRYPGIHAGNAKVATRYLDTEEALEREGLGPDPNPRDHNIHCSKWKGCDCRRKPPCLALPLYGSKRLDVDEVPSSEWAQNAEEVYEALWDLRDRCSIDVDEQYPHSVDQSSSSPNLQLVSFRH